VFSNLCRRLTHHSIISVFRLLFFICHYCLRMFFCQKELNCMYILPGYCNVISCLWVSEPARPHVCVSSSSDDGLCQLSSSGSWTHTSHAQLPYGPSADHTNRTSTHVACSTYLHTLSLLSVYLRLLLLFCECCSQCFDAVGWAAGRASGL